MNSNLKKSELYNVIKESINDKNTDILINDCINYICLKNNRDISSFGKKYEILRSKTKDFIYKLRQKLSSYSYNKENFEKAQST